ncbi:unnamed protein product [Amoebophrya sp. A120]|nr:unnamed protein product [Amoebophrya sp. A120]|eukprot:GSA120T00013021001.1
MVLCCGRPKVDIPAVTKPIEREATKPELVKPTEKVSQVNVPASPLPVDTTFEKSVDKDVVQEVTNFSAPVKDEKSDRKDTQAEPEEEEENKILDVNEPVEVPAVEEPVVELKEPTPIVEVAAEELIVEEKNVIETPKEEEPVLTFEEKRAIFDKKEEEIVVVEEEKIIEVADVEPIVSAASPASPVVPHLFAGITGLNFSGLYHLNTGIQTPRMAVSVPQIELDTGAPKVSASFTPLRMPNLQISGLGVFAAPKNYFGEHAVMRTPSVSLTPIASLAAATPVVQVLQKVEAQVVRAPESNRNSPVDAPAGNEITVEAAEVAPLEEEEPVAAEAEAEVDAEEEADVEATPTLEIVEGEATPMPIEEFVEDEVSEPAAVEAETVKEE